MLIESYRWNEGRSIEGSPHKNNPEAFPVLVIASSQRHSERPNRSLVYIDTFAGKDGESGMTFRDRNGRARTIDSPSRGRSLDDALFFIKEVLYEHAAGDSLELRLYDRRTLLTPER
jgi:hypothetical protein